MADEKDSKVKTKAQTREEWLADRVAQAAANSQVAAAPKPKKVSSGLTKAEEVKHQADLLGAPILPPPVVRKRASKTPVVLPSSARSTISASRSLDLISAALEIENQDAISAGAVGYMPRLLVQTTMPYKDTNSQVYKRENGNVTMTMFSSEGVPFGSIPRFMTAWIATEAVRTNDTVLDLGKSQNQFLTKLGLRHDGKDVRRLHEQSKRYFNTLLNIKVDVPTAGQIGYGNILVASDAFLAWNPNRPDQDSLWSSTLTLTSEFKRACTEGAIPIDMRVLNALSRSPLAMDIYMVLTWRVYIARKITTVPWERLQLQFGGTETQRMTHFRQGFMRALSQVLEIWKPSISVDKDEGLTIFPGKPHVPPLR